MQSHYPMTASRPRCAHNYYSVAACICLTAWRDDKSHASAWWMTDRLSVHLLRFCRPVFLVAVIWVYWNAVSSFGAVLVCQPQSKIHSKSSYSVRKGVSSRPVHPGIRQSCGYMSESHGSYLQKRRPGFTDDLDVLLKTTEGCTIIWSWPKPERAPCFWFVLTTDVQWTLCNQRAPLWKKSK